MEKSAYKEYGFRVPIMYPTMEDNGKIFDFMDDEDNRFQLIYDGTKWTLYKNGSVVLPGQLYDDEDTEEHQDDRDSRISDIEYEIESIEEEPDGDLDEDSVEEIVEDKKDEIRRNPKHHLDNYDMDYGNFIDKDQFIKNVVREEDYGVLGSYDGNYDQININGTDYIVMWVNK